MGNTRLGAITAVGIGIVLTALGAAGLAGAGPLAPATAAGPRNSPAPTTGSPPGAVTSAPSLPSSPSGSPAPSLTRVPLTPAPTVAASPTADRLALVRALYARIVPAIRGPDAATLLALLHPATIERYGEAACRVFFAGLRDPTFDVEVQSVASPAPWAWERDGRTTIIPDAWAVQAQLTANGSTTSQEIHVAPVGGEVRWFTDCGTPLGVSPSP
jgi:hypothetical protein